MPRLIQESKLHRSRRWLTLAVFLVAILLLLGWALFAGNRGMGSGDVGRSEVLLYYYDPLRDRDESGNILCSAAGLVGVARPAPEGDTRERIRQTVGMLIAGELTEDEQETGITTEFPLAGFSLEAVMLAEGVLTLRFSDPQQATSGGSCRTTVLRAQIEETALQFPSVTDVRIEPEELFQP